MPKKAGKPIWGNIKYYKNMSYAIDESTGDIIIGGFEKGIADSPYSGLTDMRNVNISSVPGEAGVNFATTTKTPPVITNATVTNTFTDSSGGIIFSGATGLENGMAIVFSSLSDETKGIVNGTVYWIKNFGIGGPALTGLASDYERSVNVVVTATGITGTFSTYNMSPPKYIIRQGNVMNYGSTSGDIYFMIDSAGLVWSNKNATTSGYWTYTGNTTLTGANGNGLVYYQTSDNTIGYVFAFRGAVIDYFKVTNPNGGSPAAYTVTWAYGWNPNTGTTGQITGLKSDAGSGNSHEAWVMPDGRLYFCDRSNIGKIFEVTGATFDPANTATYTYQTYPLLPFKDLAQCMAPSGTNILIGGGDNVVYSWDRVSTAVNYSYPIPESNIVKMITVNTNTYIFPGNRGRIYVTNGSQAQLYKKVPDHLSGTVEPYYAWGGVCNLKNKIYFGIAATNNAGTTRINTYGGVWSIDIDTQALMLANELSYGTYAGNATALYGQGNPTTYTLGQAYPSSSYPDGAGLVIGWDNSFAGSANGIDISAGTLYTGTQAYIISDAIPIGTLLRPNTPLQFEYKLAAPLLSGEKVEIQVASVVNGSYVNNTFTNVGSTAGLTSSTILSDNFPNTTQESQWMLVKAVLTGGTSATPSFDRLTQIRIITERPFGSK